MPQWPIVTPHSRGGTTHSSTLPCRPPETQHALKEAAPILLAPGSSPGKVSRYPALAYLLSPPPPSLPRPPSPPPSLLSTRFTATSTTATFAPLLLCHRHHRHLSRRLRRRSRCRHHHLHRHRQPLLFRDPPSPAPPSQQPVAPPPPSAADLLPPIQRCRRLSFRVCEQFFLRIDVY